MQVNRIFIQYAAGEPANIIMEGEAGARLVVVPVDYSTRMKTPLEALVITLAIPVDVETIPTAERKA
jgi:hypothetical protein